VGRPGLGEVGHLLVDARGGVRSVDAHLVGVSGVIAGLAGEVALWKDSVQSLAPDTGPAKRLRWGFHVIGQLGPAPIQCCSCLWVDGTSHFLQAAQPRHQLHEGRSI